MKYRMHIGGAWRDPAAGAWFESINPYTGAAWAEIPRGSDADVNAAVAAAVEGFKVWR